MNEIKLPYGESDFKTLREENYIYVDKTMFIEKLEKEKRAIYVRPRRFGKSLFSSMISYYYDLKEKENFEKLYKGLYIYDNPTEKKNSYYVLNFNFSGMNVNICKTESEIEDFFNTKVRLYCEDFVEKYQLPIKLENTDKPASILLQELLMKFRRLEKQNKIYIIIDEYDHFTNGMLKGDSSKYIEAVGQGGFVRAFYEIPKIV